MKFLFWLIGLPVLIIVIVFAVVNRHAVVVDMWPLPWSVQLPVFAIVLGALALGLIAGGFVAWLSAGRTRSRARREHRRAEKLEREVQVLQDEKIRLERQSDEQRSLPAP